MCQAVPDLLFRMTRALLPPQKVIPDSDPESVSMREKNEFKTDSE